MRSINMYEAKTNLSKYVELLESGNEKEIILCKRGKRIAKIVLIEEEGAKPRLDAAKGFLSALDFDLDNKELNEEIAKEFGY